MNKVTLTGRITKDPEIRYTQSGAASCSFSLAVDRGFKDNQGNKQTDFIDCVAWSNSADFISKYVHKGNMLAVVGRIQTRNYQNQQGATVYVTEVIVEQVENLTPKSSGSETSVKPSETPNQGYSQGYANPQYGQQNTPKTMPNNIPTQAQRPNPQQYQQQFNVEVEDSDLPF